MGDYELLTVVQMILGIILNVYRNFGVLIKDFWYNIDVMIGDVGNRNGSYGIENMDAKYLAEDLIENEPELFV